MKDSDQDSTASSCQEFAKRFTRGRREASTVMPNEADQSVQVRF